MEDVSSSSCEHECVIKYPLFQSSWSSLESLKDRCFLIIILFSIWPFNFFFLFYNLFSKNPCSSISLFSCILRVTYLLLLFLSCSCCSCCFCCSYSCCSCTCCSDCSCSSDLIYFLTVQLYEIQLHCNCIGQRIQISLSASSQFLVIILP